MAPVSPPSLWEPFDGRRVAADPLLTAWDGSGYVAWSWDAWQRRALEIAADLRARGIGRQDRVACLLMNSPDACAAVLGVWLAGGVVVSLPLPARGMDGDAYAEQIRRIVTLAAPSMLLCDDAFAGTIEAIVPDVRVLGFQSAGASPAGFEPDLPAAEATVFVQFSSGSTMQPKGCMLTAGAIAQQLEMLRVALAIDPERDVCVAWLPMAHDMGLFGCVLFSCWTGHHVVLGTPQRFLAQPLSWLDDLARFGGTVTGTPNFALGMLARGLRGARPPRLGLDKLLIGGERVDPVTLREFRSAMTGAVDATALMPAYGLAEVVLAATVTPVGGGAREIALDAEAVAGDRFELAGTDDPDALRLCGAGRPIGDVRVSIDAPDGTIGEILVDSPSMAVGYLEDRRATEQRFTPAGLRTGDLGCMLDGELYVTGRQDDLIVVGGRNVYARDLEWALSRLDSVRAGNCAVVALDEGPARRLVALVEHSAGKADRMALARQMSALAVRGAGVGLDACLFLSPGALPKTASGKLQRYRCRELARTHAHVEEAIRLRV